MGSGDRKEIALADFKKVGYNITLIIAAFYIHNNTALQVASLGRYFLTTSHNRHVCNTCGSILKTRELAASMAA
jgi:hypothetical protein